MKTIEKPKPEEILSALRLLGLSADVIFANIRADLDRGLVKEARSHLNFVDELSAPVRSSDGLGDWKNARDAFRKVSESTPARLLPGGGWDITRINTMNTHALAADIVSRVHHSADNPLNLAAVVEGLIKEARDNKKAKPLILAALAKSNAQKDREIDDQKRELKELDAENDRLQRHKEFLHLGSGVELSEMRSQLSTLRKQKEELEAACALALERFEQDGWPLNPDNVIAIQKLREAIGEENLP